VTTVRDLGSLTLVELQRLIGELVLTAEAHRLRMAELEAAITIASPNGQVTAPVEMATPAEG
jgi:hypothetical protein